MSKYIFDYDDGDFAMSISDSMAMDSDGSIMMRMGDHMAMDMDTGDIHMISSWADVLILLRLICASTGVLKGH